MVHFFLYDDRFERVWKNPDNDIEKVSRYRAALSPDFSMYLEMAPVMQIYDESTSDFYFEEIEKRKYCCSLHLYGLRA